MKADYRQTEPGVDSLLDLRVERDFPEAYLYAQRLPEEPPWKRISCHGKWQDMSQKLLTEEMRPHGFIRHQATPMELTLEVSQVLKHFGCCRRHRRRCAFGYGEAAERAAAR